MYFVAVILVSCMAIIVGGVWKYVVRSWRHDIVVLSEVAFHITMCDS